MAGPPSQRPSTAQAVPVDDQRCRTPETAREIVAGTPCPVGVPRALAGIPPTQGSGDRLEDARSSRGAGAFVAKIGPGTVLARCNAPGTLDSGAQRAPTKRFRDARACGGEPGP